MRDEPLHATMEEYLRHESGKRPPKSLYKHRHDLTCFWRWLQGRQAEAAGMSADELREYQRWLADVHRTPKGGLLSPASQVKRLGAVKTFYRFLERRGMLMIDPAKDLKLPKVVKHTTQRDYLSLQEVTALLQTQAKRVQDTPKEMLRWAIELRNLAFFCLAVATGRRHGGLRSLKVTDLDFERDELRVAKEKGQTGRVLPVARWAMVAAKEYVEQARPRFLSAVHSGFLFVSKKNGTVSHQAEDSLRILKEQTVAENPDLTELAGKTLTMHGLRVTFAKLLFQGGCNLRSVNEMMLHNRLSTTAYYTPLKLEELRQTCRLAHPRA